MNKTISPKIIALTFGVLVICFAVSFYALAVWQEPEKTPPQDNVAAPINVGSENQSKTARISATDFGDSDSPDFYLNPSGDSKLSSLIVVGGTSLPTCDSSYRGKLYLLQSPSGTEDGFYVCKKKDNDVYEWIALASPPKWVSIAGILRENCKVSWETGGSKGCCWVNGGSCFTATVRVGVSGDGARTATVWGQSAGCEYGDDQSVGTYCCGVRCERGNWHSGAFAEIQSAVIW